MLDLDRWRTALRAAWEFFAYPMPTTALLATALVVSTAFTLLLAILWRLHRTGRVGVALSSMSVPLLLAALLAVPRAYSGSPDENCEKYEGGNLVYTLITFAVVPSDPEREHEGGDFLLLLVRSERWGKDPHYCRLPLKGKAAALHRELISRRLGLPLGEYSRGVVTFTFGGSFEWPNVVLQPHGLPPGKDVPPEVPPRARRGT